MLKGFLLSLTMIARILLAWAAGLAVIWALGLSGMGGMAPSTWLVEIMAAASSPIMVLALFFCLVFPSVIYDSPIRFMLYAVVVAMLVCAFFGGVIWAVYALFTALPCMIIFLLSMLILPLSRLRRWLA